MVDLLLCSSAQAYVPKNEAPPVTADSFAFAFLSLSKDASLALSVLDESLETHRWTILLQVLIVAEHLLERDELHHITAQIWRRRQYQLADQRCELVLKQLLLLVRRVVVVVQVYGHIDVKWLQKVVVIDA